jgi:hypothetical protein
MSLTSPRSFLDATLAALARIGADPRDDEETRARKALLVLVCALILPVSLVWGSLYLALGSPVGYVPFLYFLVSLGGIVVFTRTRRMVPLLRVELLDIPSGTLAWSCASASTRARWWRG